MLYCYSFVILVIAFARDGFRVEFCNFDLCSTHQNVNFFSYLHTIIITIISAIYLRPTTGQRPSLERKGLGHFSHVGPVGFENFVRSIKFYFFCLSSLLCVKIYLLQGGRGRGLPPLVLRGPLEPLETKKVVKNI